MRRESELSEPGFIILNIPGDWVIIIKHCTPPWRILFSRVISMMFACKEVKMFFCLFVPSSKIPWATMPLYVTVFGHGRSGLVAFFFAWML